MADAWDPGRYEQFKAQRTAPFDDLLRLIQPVPGGAVVDLGCGTGELTARLHAHTAAAHTTGLDSSPNMLAKAAALGSDGLSFAAGDLAAVAGPARYDVVAANAALHWVGDHPAVLRGWTAALRPGGQLAVQVPTNWDHPSHLVAAEVAAEEPFAAAFGGTPPPDPVRANVLRPEDYAQLLDDLGYQAQHVRLQVYGHLLPSTGAVVDWIAGTNLTRLEAGMTPELYATFLATYRVRLLEVLGDRSPFFYPFKRILFWARLPA